MTVQKSLPAGASVLDLGAARAARAEARAAAGEGNPYLKLDAGYVEVRPEFDITLALDFQNENIEGGLAKLLVDPDDVKILLAEGLTTGDLQEITKFVSGKSLGESSASPTP